MLKYILTIICLIFSINLSAGTIDPNIPDSKYIEYAKGFVYVGKLCGTYKNNTQFCASAVAIDNHHILTAAHVVKDSKECKFIIDNKEFCITNVIYHKDFEEKVFGIADIAIGYSEKSIGLEYYPTLYEKSDEENQICSISGYGTTGNFHKGATISDNKKRAGSNYIDYIYEDLLICSPSQPTAKNRTSLEFLIASGDSGGGLFIDGKLAGINSCVMSEGRSPRSVYGDESGHTRISNFINWINKHKVKK